MAQEKPKKARIKAVARPKAEKPKKVDPLLPMKLEIAAELGLADKVKQAGWGGLTSAESGRLGGIMNRRLKASIPGSGVSSGASSGTSSGTASGDSPAVSGAQKSGN